MLPKKERLTTEEIALLEKGKSIFGSYLSIRYLPASTIKFAVSVSKKNLKRAVDRNRMKRRIYAAISGVRKKIKKPASVMIIPKKECLTLSSAQIRDEIVVLLSRAGLSA